MNKVYQVITDNILNMIEQSNTLPWRQPWVNKGGPLSIRNRPYRGINVFILGMQAAIAGYRARHWLTYNQALAMGGSVRKGEKGTTIIFWTRGKEQEDADGVKRTPFILRYYRVFNLEQTDGVDFAKAEEVLDIEPEYTEDAEAIVSSYLGSDGAPTFNTGGDECYYSPSLDHVQMPLPEQFSDGDSWHASLFHELVHSTGNVSRLDRKAEGGFSRGSYGKEELVAEMGAAFLCGEAGIASEPIVGNSASYLQGWLTSIREDATLLIKAASEAQKAVDYILGVKWENEE